MTIRKQKSGRFYAVLKVGRAYVAGKTFDTKREAQGWLARERAASQAESTPELAEPR